MSNKAIYTAAAPSAIGPYSQGISAREYAFISGQLPIDPATGVMPEDVAAIFPDVCAHRLMLSSKARMMEEKPESVLAEILKTTDMPVLKK